ncbi:MAG: hypothetical protein LAO79_23800 [Acidobacteriia bacterium]|nr:hypothetical protein [Terriglobia bacterium]
MSCPRTLRRAALAPRAKRRTSPLVPRSIIASINLASDASSPIRILERRRTMRRMSCLHMGEYRGLSSVRPASRSRCSTGSSTKRSVMPMLCSAESSVPRSATSKVNSVFGRP